MLVFDGGADNPEPAGVGERALVTHDTVESRAAARRGGYAGPEFVARHGQ
jgi:hypothetical protein